MRTLLNGLHAFPQPLSGGEGGIRTHGTVPRTQHFQCCQFSHSCTSPKRDEGRKKIEGSRRDAECRKLLAVFCLLPSAFSLPSLLIPALVSPKFQTTGRRQSIAYHGSACH